MNMSTSVNLSLMIILIIAYKAVIEDISELYLHAQQIRVTIYISVHMYNAFKCMKMHVCNSK